MQTRSTRSDGVRGADRPVRLRWASSGQALALFLVMAPLFCALLGLAIDGGSVWNARREAQNVADSAARAGADQLDLARYRATDGAEVQLDQPLARVTAASLLPGEPFTWQVNTTPQSVTVTVSREVPLSFLQLVGFRHVRISASSSARPLHGIVEGRP